jgi:hypothetical protein
MASRPILALSAILLSAPLSSGAGQGNDAAAAGCPDSVSRAVAFLRGSWQGQSYGITGQDTTIDAIMRIRSESRFGGCVLEESWDAEHKGKRLFRARVLRAYDGPAGRWLVYYADDQLNSQFYEGSKADGHWRFIRRRMDGNTPILVRLTWKPTAGGYEQLIERSRDSGKTWTLGGLARFRRSR